MWLRSRGSFKCLSRLGLEPGSGLKSLGWLWPLRSSSNWGCLRPRLGLNGSSCLGLES